MKMIASAGLLALGAVWMTVPAVHASTKLSVSCAQGLTAKIPARPAKAETGSAVMRQVMNLSGEMRDAVVTRQVLSGNVPTFLRGLTPVTFTGTEANGAAVRVTICVTPDYLSVGSNTDFVRVPLGLPSAARIADDFGFFLPTPKMVDAIYAQAKVRLVASPMPAGDQMRSTAYLLRHNQTVEEQLATFGNTLDELTAGEKKDVVFTERLRTHPGKVAIYGWQRTNGLPIQPLSTVHGAFYADYSHGIRLVSNTAFVNGQPHPLSEIFQDSGLARIISAEGTIEHPHQLLASLYSN